MSVSDSWAKSGGRSSSDRGADRRLADLADRLADARRAGDPAPEELERLVDLLARSEIDPGERLTSALEGFARLSEERRSGMSHDRASEDRAGARPAPAYPPREEARPRPPAPGELERSIAEFAKILPETRSAERRPVEERRSSEPARPAPKPEAPVSSLRSALAEISARQQALDLDPEPPVRRSPDAAPAPRAEPAPRPSSGSYSGAPKSYRYAAAERPAPAPDPIPPAALQELRGEIDRLGNSVADLPTRAEIDRMTREMSDLAKRLSEDRPARLDRDSLSAIDQLVTEVDRMRSEAASPQMITKLAEELHAISTRLDAIGPRNASAIEALARRVEDIRSELDHFPRLSAVDAVAVEIQTLIARLDAQEAAVAPTREAVVGLAGRVQALDGRIAAIADATAARDEALERINATIRSELDSLPRAEAVSDLGRQIDALTEGLKSRSAIGPALKAVEGLAGKVEALDGKIAAAARPEMFEGLGRRIDSLDEKISSFAPARPDAFDGLSRQIEALTHHIAEERRTPAVLGLDELSARIERLTEQLEADRQSDAGARIEDVTARIADLGERFDTMAAATRARGAAFEQVEESVRAIAAQMLSPTPFEASGALESELVRIVEGLAQNGARIEDLHAAFGGLASRIERSCADLGAHAAETAATAARNALVADASGGRLESELASALADMRASSAQSERRAADALDAVRSTLERMLDRLENQPGPAYPEPAEPRLRFGRDAEPEVENATEAARAAARRAMEEIADAEPPATVRARRADDAPTFHSGVGDFGPDDPIEPGAGLPRAEHQPPAPAAQSTASLIASARRATMQGAAEPLVEPRPEAGEVEKSAPFAGALGALKQRKRPVLLGVAAILIVLSALYLASGMSGEPEPAPTPPAPQSRLAPSEQPRVAPAVPAPQKEAQADPAVEEPKAEDARALAADEPPAPKATEPRAVAQGPASDLDRAAPPKAPARDLTSFAFAEAGAAAAKSRTDWKAADPAVTGSISRDAFALPDEIGGPTLRSRAKAGDAAAELEIGDRLLDGRNVPADPAAAARWFEKAAAQGSAPAQHRLGSLYEKGRGVARDVAAARRWYEQAAASGNVRAMHNLGVVHAEGGLGKPDYGAAIVWFRMAAERGLQDSAYNLAVLEARGLGGKRDLVEAYKWFSVAAEQGDQDAARKRDEVGKALGSSVGVAKAAVAAFTPKPIDPAANDPETPPGGWDRATARSETGPRTASR
ncbi:SEL1-like repeat protein [Chelatococcus sambhunathii]|uniref:SEL1-like repeat protein n=1 Tax=Chelatococcus sambhunathii TaxID=363953 RepID=A0ABU1DFF5_9HYPH|nr:hypothetical protein [Chelatococcus sambhunathii]MDR4306763.1 SEL1-like repeat protein [Chelatococcus sambhunathii]